MKKLYSEYLEGEEGIDYVKYAPGEQDPRKINQKKLEREIKAQLDVLAIDEPDIASELKKRILRTDTVVDEMLSSIIPIEEVKFYPGSDKGLHPDDDPETYSRWFYENQPESCKNEHGVPQFNG